jgi:hypothetical protein
MTALFSYINFFFSKYKYTTVLCTFTSWGVYLTAAASRLTLTSLHFINCWFCIFMNCVKCIFCARSLVFISIMNHICGSMVHMLLTSAVDYRFESWSGQNKNYKIVIFCCSGKHTVLRSKSRLVACNPDV